VESEEEEDDLQIFEESQVQADSQDEDKFLERVRQKLKLTDQDDITTARQKLREMRLKKKRQLKKQLGLLRDDEEGAPIAMLGGED